MIKGLLELVVLQSVSNLAKEVNSSAIIEDIQNRTGRKILQPEIHPTLLRSIKKGYLEMSRRESLGLRKFKFFLITSKGLEELSRQTKLLTNMGIILNG